MSPIPSTSVSLLQAIAGNPQSLRWKDLYAIYVEPMRSFLRANYPSLEADDVIQETLLALTKALPNYTYAPDAKGHFHNYLMGILKHKAMDALAARTREAEHVEEASRLLVPPSAADDDQWQRDALEVAIAQLVADPEINPLHRTVFERLVLQHERPEDVARALGTSRGNVDVIKKRMIGRLKEIVDRLVTP